MFLDFDFQFISVLSVNGVQLTIGNYIKEHRIYLLSELLTLGWNCVNVQYVNNYRKTGTGLHKFVDPADQKEYVYSQFAIFHAHRTFPCFDQPDIKARMHLTLITSTEDVALSNSLEVLERSSVDFPDYCSQFLQSVNMEFVEDLFDNGYKITKWGSLESAHHPHIVSESNSNHLMSTYLFAFFAGPYDIVEKYAEIPGRKHPIRMRFM